MTLFAELFAGIAAFGFWAVALLVAEFIFLFTCTRREVAKGSVVWGVLSMILVGVVLTFLSHINVFRMIWLNPGPSALFFAGYFVAGAIWSLFKWKLFSREKRAEFNVRYHDFIERLKQHIVHRREDFNHLKYFTLGVGKDYTPTLREDKRRVWSVCLEKGEIPDELIPEWNHSRDYGSIVPIPTEHKALLTNWIVFWPWSLLGYLLSDVLKDIADWCFERLKGVYNLISISSFRDVDERFLPKAKKS